MIEKIDDLDSNYLSTKIQKEKINSYEIKVLSENHIYGILQNHLQNYNGEQVLLYNIAGKESVVEAFTKEAWKVKDIVNMFKEIEKVLGEIEKYLLNENNIVFIPEYFFYDKGGQKIFMMYDLENESTLQQGLLTLIEFLMENAANEEDLIECIYTLYEKASISNFSYNEFFLYIDTFFDELQEKYEMLKKNKTCTEETIIQEEYEQWNNKELEDDKRKNQREAMPHLYWLLSTIILISIGIVLVFHHTEIYQYRIIGATVCSIGTLLIVPIVIKLTLLRQ